MCVITLTEFHGITGLLGAYFVGAGIPPYIRVSGTMSGCPPQQPGWQPTVSVAVTCCGVISGVSVDGAGRWSVDLPNNERCACSDPTLRTITVTCDFNTRMSLSVFDELGQRVGAADVVPHQERRVSFWPRLTGRYRVEVVNLGPGFNSCVVRYN